ncbi:response regulator [Geomonas subterranea]|uniref:hybrid sensor histidine kinase/response regulator n=1 Tax=Geomonas subterranea TaxID=2847989 RepID=UPI001C468637|nr:ATP-binding protein [Geomonas subterranea]QXM07850.1 response regulator [Geomonas subterranea]
MTARGTGHGRLRGIRERIITYFGVLSLLGGGALLLVLVYGAPWLGIEGIHGLKEAEIVRALENAADLKKQSILTWLGSRRTELALVANSEDFAGSAAALLHQPAPPAPPEDLVRLLCQHLATLTRTAPDAYDSVALVAPTGKVIAASDPGQVGSSYRYREFLDAAFTVGASEQIGTALHDREPVILISRQLAVRDREGGETGEVAAVLVSVTRPQQSLEALALLPGIADAEGNQMILVGARGELLASLPEREPASAEKDPLLARLSRQAMTMTESARLETLDDGRRIISAYRYVPLGVAQGWGIAVAMDQEKAFAPLVSTKTRAALFGLGLIAIALVLVGWGGGRVAGPIRELRNTVLALEDGDLSARAAAKTGVPQEIADLAATFNSMAGRIEDSHQQLERKVAERTRELRHEKENARRYLDLAGTMLILLGSDGRIRMINRAGGRLLGGTEEELLNLDWFDNFLPADRKKEVREVFDSLMRGEQQLLEFYENQIQTRDKGERLISWHNILMRDEEGGIQGVLCSGEDITHKRQAEQERGELERQLLHTQKLESLGVLAGGIAHDFNNLLMAIGGNLELVRQAVEPGSSVTKYLDNAHQAVKRAGDLTRQMLAYSGKGGYSVKLVDLNLLVGENVELMKASLRKGAVVTVQLQPGLPLFEADPGQMLQVIVNLVTNAIEAAGEGGTISVATGLAEFQATQLGRSRLERKPPPGSFLFLRVADNGCGMDRATCERMFDPFFSTKFTGRGLGLSAVQGIVRGHGGAIFVETGAGAGTTVQVLFPVVGPPSTAEVATPPARRETATPRGTVLERALAKEAEGRDGAAVEKTALVAAPGDASAPEVKGDGKPGTVLIVDDDEMVRLVCRAMVRGLGYSTMLASDGAEAVELFGKHAAEIGYVIMDLSMPQMDGMTAAERLRGIRPDVRIILSSGYSAIEEARRLSGQRGALFIQKPYDLESLKQVLGDKEPL